MSDNPKTGKNQQNQHEEKGQEQPESVQKEEEKQEQPESVQEVEQKEEQPKAAQAEEQKAEQPESAQAEEQKAEQPDSAPQAEEPKAEQPEPAPQAEEPRAEQPASAPQEETKADSKPRQHPADGPERVISLSDLKEEDEYDSEETAFMSRLYEDTMQQIKPGEIITGRIISISDRDVAIDIGFKSEGTVPIEEFEDPTALNIGDSIEVYLENIEDQDGQLVLSKRKADFARVWSEIMGIYERGETISGRCSRRIKGGIVVDVKGIDAFLPGSQIDIHPVRDFDAWIGEVCEYRIVKINEARKNIVLSRKVLIEETLRDVREQILSDIQIGQDIEGVVKNITDFGAFVDLGGVDGLLHITDISWGRVNNPSEVVAYDQKLMVRVLDFDPVRKRISVGLKQLYPHPWEGVEDRYPVNSRVTGKVVSITKYGAFVELEEGIEGLIHISEMSWTQHIKHPSQILNIGQEVEIVVLSIDAENRKVSLGLKQTEEDPWEKLEQKYTVSSMHKGVVRDLVPFGAFVELEEGVEGLVHISDLSWTRKVRHPGEIVKKGDEIDVTILSFDRDERRIALGHKQTAENPWELFEKEFPVGSRIDGSVIRTVDKGAIVELKWGLESFLPVSHFGKDPETGRAKALKEGEQLQVEVIDFDKDNKKIVVSSTAIQKRAEEAEYQEYLKEQEAATQDEPAKAAETAEAAPEGEAEAAAAETEIPKEETKPAEEKPAEEIKAEAPEEAAVQETLPAEKAESPKEVAPEATAEKKAAKAEKKVKPAAKKKKTKAAEEPKTEAGEEKVAEEKPKPKKKTAKKTPAKKEKKSKEAEAPKTEPKAEAAKEEKAAKAKKTTKSKSGKKATPKDKEASDSKKEPKEK